MSALLRQMLADSPLGLWTLDETSGTTARDASGNGKHGTYAGAPALGQKVGQFLCPTFDGVNDTVSIPDAAQVFAGQPLTWAAWFRTTMQGYSSILAKYNAFQNNAKWNLRLDDNEKLNAYFDSSSGALRAISGQVVNDGRWHYGAAVWTKTGSTHTADILVDGVLAGTGTSLASLYAESEGAQVVTIGSYDGSIEFFNGNIAYAAVYQSALSSARIRAHYEAGLRMGVAVG